MRNRQAKAAPEAEPKSARAVEMREQAPNSEQIAAAHAGTTQCRTAETHAKKRATTADELGPRRDDDPPDEPGPPTLPLHRPPTTPSGKPKGKAQRGFTDPDSRIMVDGTDSVVQACKAQAAVEKDTQPIVAAAVSNRPPDTEYLPPVMVLVEAVAGSEPKVLMANAGHLSAEVACCEAQGIDAYISVRRQRHGPAPPPTGSPPPEKTTPKEKMTAWVNSGTGPEIYRKRRTIPEPVFGQIKEARGLRRILLRGLTTGPKSRT